MIFNYDNLIYCVKQIQTCLKKTSTINKSIILIPFGFKINDSYSYTSHKNLLIFRTTRDKLEWFEPHGNCFLLNPEHTATKKIEELVNEFNKILNDKLEVEIELEKPDIICPLNGVQTIEGRCTTLPENLGGGYCALWSLFFLEKILEFKDMTTKEINETFLKRYNTPEELRKIMISYTSTLSKRLKKYKDVNLNEIINYNKKNGTAKVKELINRVTKKRNKDINGATIKKNKNKENRTSKNSVSSSSLDSETLSSSLFSNLSPGVEYSDDEK